MNEQTKELAPETSKLVVPTEPKREDTTPTEKVEEKKEAN